jgi:hypothetical protein
LREAGTKGLRDKEYGGKESFDANAEILVSCVDGRDHGSGGAETGGQALG